jgi:prepilin-type N-terminal cleavage/methylation domain-containing protein
MSRGFTLVELVVALAILAMMAALAAPAVGSLGREDPRARLGREVVTLLERSRATALERGEPVSVTLDPATGRYWVALEGDVPDDLVTGSLQLPPDVRLYAAQPRLRFSFYPTGGCDPDTVVVRGGESAVLVTADRWTGAPYAR